MDCGLRQSIRAREQVGRCEVGSVLDLKLSVWGSSFGAIGIALFAQSFHVLLLLCARGPV